MLGKRVFKTKTFDRWAKKFLVGRQKNAPGADFPDAVVDAVKVIASSLHAQSVAKLDQMKASGELKEICNAKKEQ